MTLIMMFVISSLSAQTPDAIIKQDPNVKIGKLDNGLTYYIRENNKPEDRVIMRIVVNAGSMQETDAQVGLAHFAEHMAFNGIEGYPGNTMIDELQKIGVSFGRQINAYTSFDETVYEVTLPTDDSKNIEMGMNILKGWANGILFDNKEIDQERGIIVEEYRTGLGADDRMRKQWFPVAFNGSRYAERLPIGTLENIQNFEYQTIKDFYAEWYRPDLQALIIVGDIDAEQIEREIKEKFTAIPKRENSQPKIIYEIPDNKEPLVAICTDKEARGSQFMVFRKFDEFTMKTEGDFKKMLAIDLYNMMLSSRFAELQQKADCPFLGASSGYGAFIGSCDVYMGSGAAKEGRVIESLQTILREDYRVLKHGFVQTEFDRAKEEILSRYERAANEADKTESMSFTEEYVQHYLKGAPIPGAKREFVFAKRYLPQITLEEVNAFAKEWIIADNLVAIVMAPDKEGVQVPTKEEVLAVINDKSLMEVEAYVDTYKEKEIVDKTTLTKGKVESTKELTVIGAKELTLSNGIKVILKQTTFKNDEIQFSAISKGGASLYPVEDLPSLNFATQLLDRAGLGELDLLSLQKKLQGKQVSLSPYISTMEEGMSGSSTPKDLETFFQILHAQFTAPRHDPSVRELVISETAEGLKMINAMPKYKFIGKLMEEATQNNPYAKTQLSFTDDYLKQVDYERAFQIYKERFANPADFTFIFVGNFDEKALTEYLELYVGSLKTTAERENYKDVKIEFPKESVTKQVYAGLEEQSTIAEIWNNDFENTKKNKMIVDQISEALQIELIEVIREKMSATYSPMLQMDYETQPKTSFTTMVMLDCKPDNTDNILENVEKILASFKKKGPKPATLVKVKEQMISARQTGMEKNGFWIGYINGTYYYDLDINRINTYEDDVNIITKNDIIDFMEQYFNIEHSLRMDLYPEAMKK